MKARIAFYSFTFQWRSSNEHLKVMQGKLPSLMFFTPFKEKKDRELVCVTICSESVSCLSSWMFQCYKCFFFQFSFIWSSCLNSLDFANHVKSWVANIRNLERFLLGNFGNWREILAIGMKFGFCSLWKSIKIMGHMNCFLEINIVCNLQ